MAIYRGTGGSSTTTDETTVNAVNQKAAEAATSATNAASSASSAATSASTANTKAILASNAADNATTASAQAFSSKEAAAISAASAAASELAAANSATAAESAETNAILYGNMANTAAGDADADRILAEAAANSANTYAAAALVSANNAASYDAAVEANATAAALSETNAAASESAASVSAIAADASASDAATSEANAAASETASAASAASASTSATTATTQATAASASATAAATSEANASTSATNAATSATNAATSETNAAASETAAAASKTAAEAAKDAALEALDSFDDRYLGQKASDPTVDNDGNALVAGALYFNTTDDVMKVYEGSTWVAAYASLSGALLADNNLSDLLNATAARTNLGLGTAATTASTDYATAAQGALADSALQAADLGVSVQSHSSVLDNTTASYTIAEQSKLAGIEAGATGDQTASEILTALKTVDGAGSGLDADLLDGQSGAYYTDYADAAIANLVDTAPSALDTLNELAAALGDDPNFATTVSTNIGTKVSKSGDTMTGDLNFGDNDKAVFGAGSDLQIYHDGAKSVIADAGTGNLVIAAQDLVVTNADQTATLLYADAPTGGVTLYHNNAGKLATTSTGIDVTGTATMDGLDVATTSGTVASFYDDNAGVIKVGNNTATTGNTASLYLNHNSLDGVRITSEAKESFADAGSRTADLTVSTRHNGNLYDRINVASDGDISFYEDTGTTAKFFWDASAESLGIGTSSPSEALHIQNGALNLQHNSGTPTIRMNDEGVGSCYIKMPDGSNALAVETGGSERMRIDSSGNLLVGKTSTGYETQGASIRSSGRLFVTSNGESTALLNRLTSDGDILTFAKDTATVGSIGTGLSSLSVGTGSTYLTFYDAGNELLPAGSSSAANRDATISLGNGGRRFKDLYLSGSLSDGTNSVTIADLADSGGGAASSTVSVFTSSGTWTKPSGCKKVKVIVTGGGGYGQNRPGNYGTGGSGSAGGTAIDIVNVEAVNSVSVTVGGAGSASSFGSYCSANAGSGNTGGNGSGGTINIQGGRGMSTTGYSEAGTIQGGAGFWGGGSNAYGSGGHGGSSSNAGKQGVVYIEEWY